MTSRPDISDSRCKQKLDDLYRLLGADLSRSQYLDATGAAKLIRASMISLRKSLPDPSWNSDSFLARAKLAGLEFRLALAAIFDLVCNVEYCHGRVVSSKWIYCDAVAPQETRGYFSFLKQCPRCCLSHGLDPRLSGAQHKPSSHHIGEITGNVAAMLLRVVTHDVEREVNVEVVSKQSHDVDAALFLDDLIVLCEIKASPMVTYPLATSFVDALYTEEDGVRTPYARHSLIDVQFDSRELSLFIPHRNIHVPLGIKRGGSWPYEAVIEFVSDPRHFLDWFSAWLELFEAYSVPKTERVGKNVALAYLVNGWGDEIDSNKTKPGLGRTDDIKKGTYQLLKFGTYYRDDEAKTRVRGALIANLDPLFLREMYFDRLANVRWGRGDDFVRHKDHYVIDAGRLRYLYDAVVSFNEPTTNDPLLATVFDFDRAWRLLRDGATDGFLANEEGLLKGT